MAATEFKYEALAELLLDRKSIERVDISKGKNVLKKLQDQQRYQVKLVIDARFSGPNGGGILKGYPLGKTFEVVWTVDTDDGKLNILSSPKKNESDGRLMPDDEVRAEGIRSR